MIQIPDKSQMKFSDSTNAPKNQPKSCSDIKFLKHCSQEKEEITIMSRCKSETSGFYYLWSSASLSSQVAANELRNSTVFAMNMFTYGADQTSRAFSRRPKNKRLRFGEVNLGTQMLVRKREGEMDQVDSPLVGDGYSPHALLVVFVPSVFRWRGQAARGARRGRSEVMTHGFLLRVGGYWGVGKK